MIAKLGIIGEYNLESKTHLALNNSLEHLRIKFASPFTYEWIDTSLIELDPEGNLKELSGIWSASGGPFKSLRGVLSAIEYARKNDIPFLGTCSGFQYSIIEFARNVLNIKDAQHEELEATSSNLIINRLSCSLTGLKMKIYIKEGTKVFTSYVINEIEEEYYCKFGINYQFRERLNHPDLIIAGMDQNNEIRIIELRENRFFLATLFVPHINSTQEYPHPLIYSFLKAALVKSI